MSKSTRKKIMDKIRQVTRKKSAMRNEINKEIALVEMGEPSDSQNIPKVLMNLDNQFIQTQSIAKEWMSTKTIPQIDFTKAEKKLMKSKKKEVEELEKYLVEKYASDFNSPAGLVWHGRTSYQRIIWQDEKFIAAMSDPLFVKVLLDRATPKKAKKGEMKKEEPQLGNVDKNLSLSSLVLSGLSSNKISYLASVSPNWMKTPDVKGVNWNSALVQMNVPGKETEPRVVSSDYLRNMHKALVNMQQVLNIAQKNELTSEPSNEMVNQFIANGTNSQLLDVIEILVKNDNTIGVITAGVAGSSTKPTHMNEQCLEVMSQYSKLLEHHKGDHAKALGYGLVSHALDAKHFIAALYFLDKPLENDPPINEQRQQVLNEGKMALRNLLSDLKKGLGEPEADALLRSRLQQMLSHVVSIKKDIGLTDEKLISIIGSKQEATSSRVPPISAAWSHIHNDSVKKNTNHSQLIEEYILARDKFIAQRDANIPDQQLTNQLNGIMNEKAILLDKQVPKGSIYINKIATMLNNSQIFENAILQYQNASKSKDYTKKAVLETLTKSIKDDVELKIEALEALSSIHEPLVEQLVNRAKEKLVSDLEVLQEKTGISINQIPKVENFLKNIATSKDEVHTKRKLQ
jgi:hypothetical protein